VAVVVPTILANRAMEMACFVRKSPSCIGWDIYVLRN
jgi:hypothetical protein